LAGEFELPHGGCSFGPQEPHEVCVSTKSKVTQAQLQAGDDPPQEIYAVLGFEPSGVPFAQVEAVPPELAPLFAILSSETMIELASALVACVSIEDALPGHEDISPLVGPGISPE
jgi:hypothetical protein